MTIKSNKTVMGLMALSLTLGTAFAQIGAIAPAPPPPPAPGQPPPQLSATEQWIKDVKNPASWLNWGGDLRLRNEYGDNHESLGNAYPRHEQDYFRFRGRVWMTLTPVKNFEFNTRVTAESRVWMKPSFSPLVRNENASGFNSGGDWTEGIIDQLNFKWKEAFGAPLTMTVGRQDMAFGDFYDWWLVADGTPNDGSRTLYFDAARLTLDLKEQKTTIDAVGICQFAHNNDWLPPINHLKRNQTDQDERGAILYVSNKSIKNTQLDGYFMYKNDRARTSKGYSGDIYTMGGKVTGNLNEHLRYSVEGAYQTGKRTSSDQDIDAFGIKNRLTYSLKDSMNTQFRLCHEYLTGDDTSTDAMEGFDPLWARYPRWSELYIYSYGRETRVAHINNIHRVGPGFTIVPVKNLAFSADYNALFAPEDAPATAGPNLSRYNNGGFRGHFIQAVLKYKFSSHVAAHLWSEFIFMGDYYKERDLMTFLRAEVMFTF